MTAFNRERYIAEAIESVLAQTFADFELIIVDDCSKDATEEIARRYTGDPRVRVHRNEENLGDYVNRNRAASYARAVLLKYVDSDDIIYPHGLGVAVEAMKRFPEAAFGLERPPVLERPYPVQMSPREAYREHFLGDGLFGCGPSGAVIRTRALVEAGGFSGKRFVGDTELWLKLAARWPVVKLMQGLVWWRQHEGQEIRIGGTRLETAAAFFNLAMAALLAPDCPLSAEEGRLAVRGWIRFHLRRILRMALREGRPRDAIRLLRQSELRVSQVVAALR